MTFMPSSPVTNTAVVDVYQGSAELPVAASSERTANILSFTVNNKIMGVRIFSSVHRPFTAGTIDDGTFGTGEQFLYTPSWANGQFHYLSVTGVGQRQINTTDWFTVQPFMGGAGYSYLTAGRVDLTTPNQQIPCMIDSDFSGSRVELYNYQPTSGSSTTCTVRLRVTASNFSAKAHALVLVYRKA